MATEIRIDRTGDGTWWLYGKYEEWKNYVCADFDEKIVVYGNRDYDEIAEATWWVKAKEIIEELDFNGTSDRDVDDMAKFYKCTSDNIKEIIKAYDECKYCYDIDFIVKVANILFPEKKIETGSLHGYVQREWQYFAYASAEFDTDITEPLEAFYFGKIAEVTVIPDGNDDDSCGDILTDDELWEMERKGLKEELRKRYDIPEDEELIVMQCDGYIQIADWNEVE